ncbi:MAG: phosphoribosylaminoimidazolesuccinocarboxamide synthase [Chloroflexota bacterium]
MLTQQELRDAIPNCVDTIDSDALGEKIQGKVRDSYVKGNQRILVATDRISAFDSILGQIPYRGQVLNQLSAWWFVQTQDIIGNHMLDVPDPNVMVCREAETLPVEVVVRGYITGVTDTALWTLYAAGEREPYGIPLPDGLQKNDKLPEPIITPTTKATHGHDERLTNDEVVSRGIVDADTWATVQEKAIAVFKRGQEKADKAGLILVDTKYEFGMIDGELVLIDEVHTPDSSRYWTKASYAEGNPENISKEFMREWFKTQGYTGEGKPPAMPDEVIAQVASRYIEAYEALTGEVFVPGEQPAKDRIHAVLKTLSKS